MPYRQLADAGAQSNTASGAAITATQTSVTLQSASGFPGIVSGGQLSVTILDGGNPAFNPAAPLATPFEYQQVNAISGNVLTFGPGGGSAQRVAYAGTTPKSFFAGSGTLAPIIAVGMLAEDIVASAPWKFDEQTPTGSSLTIPAVGTIPGSYLGITFRHAFIVWEARDSSANAGDILGMTFNADGTANYDSQLQQLSGTSVTTLANIGTNSGRVGIVAGGASGAGLFNSGSIWVKFFSSSSFRRTYMAECFRADTFGFEENAGNWRNNTNAITTIGLALPAGAFVAPSIFTTYLYP